MVQAFLVQSETDLAAMQRALPREDGETLAAAAHGLAGSAAILGAAGLAESAGELARLARRGELGACGPRLLEVEREYSSVAVRLRT
jgi:HPt (histidine-containing phosphotransfer) domain-containing protein